MRKTTIIVLAIFIMVGTFALVHPEKSAAQAQQQPVAEKKKSAVQIQRLSPKAPPLRQPIAANAIKSFTESTLLDSDLTCLQSDCLQGSESKGYFPFREEY